jgi:hypothetical protein
MPISTAHTAVAHIICSKVMLYVSVAENRGAQFRSCEAASAAQKNLSKI